MFVTHLTAKLFEFRTTASKRVQRLRSADRKCDRGTVPCHTDPYYHWNLITTDPDDNKFVDCAFAAGATYIVSDDSHFNILRDITFPQLIVLRLKEFLKSLQKEEL